MAMKNPDRLYEDDRLAMLIPSYMRAKRGIRCFVGHSAQSRSPGLAAMAVEFVDGPVAQARRRQLRVTQTTQPWMGVEFQIVRQGEAGWCRNGTECVVTTV